MNLPKDAGVLPQAIGSGGALYRLRKGVRLTALMRWGVVVCLLAIICARPASAQGAPADIVLKGQVTGSQNKTYFEVPFSVPRGTHRIGVDFEDTGKQQRTTLDLGIADPERFRGESGGNKSHFTISGTDATPSYLASPIPVGR